ncbi:hypothetical protein HPB49_014754 [Dermacentor silvarum]|uniref:Uncharacterized protein n=1 Tax=Dermacentor silvarum TaxID=543639 RepID=A0ACB8CXJ0_DERSI|nr:hypothetical protein HPB49_014754 [Dermacentor silvarum]
MTERTKSAIGKHFVKNSAQEATCKSCDMKLRTPSSTTTPPANHLKNKHLSLHSVFLRDSGKQGRPEGAQPLIRSALKSGKDLSQRERTAITTRISRMLALNLQPYICVENRGFKELMNHMEPLYKIPSRTTFSRTIIPALYRDTVTAVKERMHADFQEGIESISFTSDMWTSRSNQSYISLTCHYLTSNFEMRSFALDNRSVTESHTACNIMEHLQAMMDNWELPLQEVSVYVVTDNARNFPHKERVSSIWDSIEELTASSKRRHSFKTANIEEFQRYLREPTYTIVNCFRHSSFVRNADSLEAEDANVNENAEEGDSRFNRLLPPDVPLDEYIHINSDVAGCLNDDELLDVLGDKDPDYDSENAPVVDACQMLRRTAKEADDTLKVLEDICVISPDSLRGLHHLQELRKTVLHTEISHA